MTNAGSMTGIVFIDGGGSVTNLAGARISDGLVGVYVGHGSTVTNAGSISGSLVGVYVSHGGTVTNTGIIAGPVGSAVYGSVWFADGAAALAYDHGDSTRQIVLPGLSRTATGSFDGFSGGLLASAGWRWSPSPGFLLEPSAGLLYSHVDQGGFTETGAGAVDLAVASGSTDQVQSRIGVRLRDRSAVGAEGSLEPELSLGWAHELAGLAPKLSESFPAVSSSSFTVTGASPNRDEALIGAGLTYRSSARLALYGRYQATLGQRETDHAISAGFKFIW